MRTKNRRAEMGIWSLIVVLLISSTASLKKKCPSNILKKFLSDPSNAKEHYDNGEAINVTCLADSGDDGYEYSNYDGSEGLDTKNIRVLKCTDGKWIGHYPGCFSNCSKPDIYAILNPEYDVYAPGDNVTVTACKKDNAGIEGDTTLICMADGTWIGSARCPKQHMSCNEQPQTISNAYITDVVRDEYKHGTVLQYKCSQAFDQMGKYSVRCHDGRWIPDSASRIRCIIGHCSHIYSRDIGNMRVKNISGQVGTYAEFECYDGYELDGSAKILCMADRKWYPEIPKCKPISCPPPKQILHGSLIQEAYNGLLNIYQSTIRYDCDQGYRIVGPRFRKCQSDRTWSGNDTKCEEIVCEKPSNPENGKVYLTDNSQKVGSQIEYICDEHHIMEPITSQFAICTVHGHWSSPQPLCIKICKVRALSHGSIRTISGFERKKTEDSYVHDNTELYFTCNDGYERYASGYETRGRLKCVNITLLPGPPECRPKRCFIEPPIDLEYFVGQEQVLNKYIYSGFRMHARCSNRTELFRSSSYLDREQVPVNCNFGKLEPESLVCQDKRCKIITTIENGHFTNRGKEIVTGEKIYSGSDIKLICSEGYEPYNKTNSMYLELENTYIKCYQGSFTSEIPSCKPKRCFIKPPIDLEYFVGQEQVLNKYIYSGFRMHAKCSNRTELFRSSSYLDREQVPVNCNFGKLEPESLVCQDKRCKIITTIENGHFTNRGKEIVTGEKIYSGSDIKLICSEGYEPYNKTNSMYLELENTYIKCYQGSFTSEIPSCKPKRCFIKPPIDLEYFVGQEQVLNKYIYSGFRMHAKCSNRTELFRSSSYLDREQVPVNCNFGKLEPESLVCQDKRCKIITTIENGHFTNRGKEIVTGEKIYSGSDIKLICSEGYEPYNKTNSMYLELENTYIKCYQGSFTSEIPSCKPKRCFIKPPIDLEYFVGQEQVLNKYIYSGFRMHAKCSNRTELFRSSSYLDREQVPVNCNFGKLEPESLVCQDKRCKIITTIENGHFTNRGKEIVTGEKIYSGSDIKLICSEGYELYNKTNSMYLELEQTDIKCYQGSFTPEIPSCKPRPCLIEPSVFLEYFIEGNKVLQKYVDNGTLMQARCPDRMELVLSSSYLDSEHYFVQCTLGTLEPRTLDCKDKRCNITQIENGKLVNGENVIDPRAMIGSNSNITLVCSEGYELYNESISMYLESEKTDILCYQGSFNVAFPNCRPKRCQVGKSLFLLPEVHYVEHGHNLTVHCPDKMEFHPERNGQNLEELLMFCSNGKWTPTLPMCIKKMCKTIDVAREITGFIVRETKTKPGEFVPHNQSIQIVCGEGYRPHRILTCNAGIWMGKSTCELEIICDSFYDYNLENGHIFYSSRYAYTVGTVASFLCNSGYVRDGPETRTCQIDGTWSGECVTCQRITRNPSITCPAPCVPEGARKTGSHTYEIGSRVEFNCPRSKTQDRDDIISIMYCIKDGEYASWNGTMSNCKEMCKISDLSREITDFIVSETKTTPGEFVPHNQSIKAVCGDGNRSQGVLTCNAGIWTGNSTCELGCVLKDPGMHFISLGNRTVLNVGENANVSCKFGYQIVSNKSTTHADQYDYGASASTANPYEMSETEDNENLIAVSDGSYTCRDSGKWEPEIRFSCKQMCKTIDLAREITGFIVSETKTKPGEFISHNQSIEIVCGEGYRPHGSLTCNAGIWMGNATCEPDVTGCVLKDPGMHFISLGNRKVLKVGENANVSCEFGYQIVPNLSAKRAYEYYYGDSESTADPYEMPETEDNENFIAVSDGNYTCRDNGKWEPELRFSCKQIVCDSFDRFNLENGNIIYSTHYVYTVGTVASFQCNPGYFRHGSETRTCQVDGTWSGECVTCQRITLNISMTCPAPCVPEGARKTGSHTYEIGSIVKFNCPRSKTQDRDDRSNIRHCIKNGEYASWNGTKINCKEIICDKGDHYGFENGRVTYSSSVATVGTEASFMCNSGYNRHGPKTRICQKDGTWSGGCVKCQKHQHNSSTCPAPCVPDGAKKTGSLSYEIGSRIQFYCFQANMNFNVENSYIRHCVNDGKSASWNGTEINCKVKCKPLTDTYNVVQTGVVPGILSDKTVVELICNGSLVPVRAECRKGRWHPKKPTCKYTCPLSAVKGTLYNYKVRKDQVFPGPIESGSQIKVTCEDGFFPNTHNYDVSKCVNGVWTPEIVKCEKTDNF